MQGFEDPAYYATLKGTAYTNLYRDYRYWQHGGLKRHPQNQALFAV